MANHRRLAERSRAEDPFHTYLREINQTALLTEDEEIELFERFKQGDADARAHLIKANRRLVVSIARRYLGRGLDIEDLVGEGNLGLIHAIEKYDLAFDGKFSTYASWWIKEFIQRALNHDRRRYRLSGPEVKFLAKILDAGISLSEILARPATYEEVGKHLGLSEAKIKSIPKLIARGEFRFSICQLDSLEDDCQADSIAAPIDSPEAIAEESDELGALFASLERLSATEQAIIRWRFELDGEVNCSAMEFAKRHNLSIYGLRSTEERAMRKLRADLTSNRPVRGQGKTTTTTARGARRKFDQ